LKYKTGSLIVIYGNIKNAVYDKHGLKYPVSMWGKTIKDILVIPGDYKW